MKDNQPNRFEQADPGGQARLVSEIIQFLKHNKKYWLVPLLVVLLALGALVILGGTAVAPFIYTLF